MVIVAVALAYWSKSNNLRIATLIITLNWLLSNFVTTNVGALSMNYIAPMDILFAGALFVLYRKQELKGRTFYRPLLFFYALYLLLDFYHLGARIFFPETLSATYYFVMLSSNVVFILIMVTLWGLSILKGVGNRTEGGMMAVYASWRSRLLKRDRK